MHEDDFDDEEEEANHADEKDLYIIESVCLCHKSNYFRIQAILLFHLFLDTFCIQ